LPAGPLWKRGRVTFVKKSDRDDEFVEIVGAPELVVEVVGASSVKRDLAWLRAAYARAGVREYWLVDAREILMNLLAQDLRCLDAHAHLGNFEFERRPRHALRH
jgi:Uma2 family endonuclease